MKYLHEIFDAVKKCFQAGKKFWDECTEAENIVAAARVADIREKQVVDMKLDYERVANAVRDLLIGNHAKVGLKCPHLIEDIYVADNDNPIQISQIGKITFDYEIDRNGSDAYVGGMKRLEYPAVPKEKIEAFFAKRLPIYANRKGYYFKTVTVDDISESRVRVSLYGVYCAISQL